LRSAFFPVYKKGENMLLKSVRLCQPGEKRSLFLYNVPPIQTGGKVGRPGEGDSYLSDPFTGLMYFVLRFLRPPQINFQSMQGEGEKAFHEKGLKVHALSFYRHLPVAQ